MDPTSKVPSNTENKEQEKPKKAWANLFEAQSRYFDNIICLKEMVGTVSPILTTKDKERLQRINEIKSKSEKFKSGESNVSYEEYKELLDHVRKIRKSDNMFRHSILTLIVSRYDEFLSDILRAAYFQNPSWLKSSDRKISHREVLELESLESFKTSLIEKEIDQLMRDSHLEQIRFLDEKLKLGIAENYKGFSDFLEITERRNLFVHTGGIVSPSYMGNCKKMAITIDSKAKEGVRLGAPDKYLQKAFDCFYEISVRICQAVSRRLFPDCYEAADRFLNNRGVDLLLEGNTELAEKIFTYALSIPEHLRSKGDLPYHFIINLCIAEKRLGKNFKERLDKTNWSPFHPKYHFAIAVLEDRFSEAAKLMQGESVKTQLKPQTFKEWPLLTEFVKSREFLDSYHSTYGKDFNEAMVDDVKIEIREQKRQLA